MQNRKKRLFSPAQFLAVAALLVFSVCWILVYALTIANVGALYRVRLPIMVLLMGLGFLAWCRILNAKRV